MYHIIHVLCTLWTTRQPSGLRALFCRGAQELLAGQGTYHLDTYHLDTYHLGTYHRAPLPSDTWLSRPGGSVLIS